MNRDPGYCQSCGQQLPYASWRAELLDRAPAIVAEGGPGSDWWRREYIAEIGRDPAFQLELIQGGKA